MRSATVEATQRSLTRPGAILLVSCYELGHQPLALALLAAQLVHAGFAPATVDTSVEPLDDAVIAAASLVAISVPMHTALRLGARVATRVRAVNPSAHIAFYGHYATLNAEHLLREAADSVHSGESEAALVGLARALDLGERPEAVPGVGTRDQAAAPVLERLTLVPPRRHGLPPLRRYAGLERDGVIVRAGYVEATRGCRHTCRHCPITPIYGGRFFALDRDLVLADARAQIRAGARHITFGDPDFFNGPAHGPRIMRALRADQPDLTFDATIKVEHLLQHRRLLPELADLGCLFVVSAVESLSDRVLAKLAKGHTRPDVDEALAVLDRCNIAMRPSLLPFTPWATLDDYVELLTWVAVNDLHDHVDPVHLSIRLLIPPGSALLDDPEANEWLGPLEPAEFSHRWSHPDPRCDDLHADVARLVERAATDHEESRATFAGIWNLAFAARGESPPPIPEPIGKRAKPPRLTESWFC